MIHLQSLEQISGYSRRMLKNSFLGLSKEFLACPYWKWTMGLFILKMGLFILKADILFRFLWKLEYPSENQGSKNVAHLNRYGVASTIRKQGQRLWTTQGMLRFEASKPDVFWFGLSKIQILTSPLSKAGPSYFDFFSFLRWRFHKVISIIFSIWASKLIVK